MLTLDCQYQKKLSLPGYSSHQFSITIRTELTDLSQVEAESSRLYALLQSSVDRELQKPGFIPEPPRGNGGANGGGHKQNGDDVPWNCSDRQRALVLKLVDTHHLPKAQVEALAQERFGKKVVELNRLECSGLIEELLSMTGQLKGNGRGRFQKAGA